MSKFAKVKQTNHISMGKDTSEQVVTKHGAVVKTDGTVVKVALGVTVSKSYQSVRVDCGVEWPTTKEGHLQAFKDAWTLVGNELGEQMDAANKFLARIG